jgi:hypothetical protein
MRTAQSTAATSRTARVARAAPPLQPLMNRRSARRSALIRTASACTATPRLRLHHATGTSAPRPARPVRALFSPLRSRGRFARARGCRVCASPGHVDRGNRCQACGRTRIIHPQSLEPKGPQNTPKPDRTRPWSKGRCCRTHLLEPQLLTPTREPTQPEASAHRPTQTLAPPPPPTAAARESPRGPRVRVPLFRLH